MKKIFFVIFFFFSCNSVSFSENLAQYIMILNAEENDTYLHLFSYTENDDHFPMINEIYTAHSSATLALFKDNPTRSFQAIKPLLDNAINELQKLALKNPVMLRILGGDSMRFLNKEAETAIFANIQNNIILKYQKYLRVMDAAILPGKMEALYRWLAVNYLAMHLQNQTPTLGILDIEDRSTQIAFAIPASKKPIDEVRLTINGKKYIVFTKNFLGLGLKEMEESIHTDLDAKYCYPKHAPFNENDDGDFNLINCSALYQEILKKYNIPSQILPLYTVPHFVIFPSIYPIYQFFGKDAFVDKETLEENILTPICGNDWSALKDAYAALPEPLLLSNCANAVFLSNLLFNTLQLHGSQVNISKTMNDKKIDWTLGAAFASLASFN